MSANSTNGWGPIGLTTQLPAGDTVRQQANAQARGEPRDLVE